MVSCVFEIDDALISKIQAAVGENTFNQKTITIGKRYSGSRTYYDLKSNTQAFITYFLSKYTISAEKKKELEKSKTVNALYELLLKDADLGAISTNLKTDYIDKAFSGFNSDIV